MDESKGWRPEPLVIEVERADGAYVLTISGEIDMATVERLELALAEAQATDAEKIIVDLSGIDFIDSQGLHALRVAEDASRANSNRLRFLRGNARTARVMRITGLEEELRFLD